MKKIKKIMLGLFIGTSLVSSTAALSVIMSSCTTSKQDVLPKIAVTDLLDNSPIEDYIQNTYDSVSSENPNYYSTNILTKLETRVYNNDEIFIGNSLDPNSSYSLKHFSKYDEKGEITKQDWETDEKLKKIKYIKSIYTFSNIKSLYIPEHIEVIGEDIIGAERNGMPPIKINKLPDNLLYLGSNTFIYEQLTLPKTLRYIGKNAFARTHMIEDFKDMSSLTKLRFIGENSFGNLQDDSYIQFDKLIFPDSLEVINDAYSSSILDYYIKLSSEEKTDYFYGINTIFLKAKEVVMPANLKYFAGSSFNLTQVQSLDFTKVKQENFKTLFPVKDERVRFLTNIASGTRNKWQTYDLHGKQDKDLIVSWRNSIFNMNIIVKGETTPQISWNPTIASKKYVEQAKGQMTLKLPGFMEKRFTNNYTKDTDKIFKTNNIKFEFFH